MKGKKVLVLTVGHREYVLPSGANLNVLVKLFGKAQLVDYVDTDRGYQRIISKEPLEVGISTVEIFERNQVTPRRCKPEPKQSQSAKDPHAEDPKPEPVKKAPAVAVSEALQMMREAAEGVEHPELVINIPGAPRRLTKQLNPAGPLQIDFQEPQPQKYLKGAS